MGLQPLEFSDCLTDSPYFREKLHTHEKELERTSKAIKALTNHAKELIAAAKNLSKCQRQLSDTLSQFKFDCIGGVQTEDEKVIECSLQEFGKLISTIEDERDRMLEKSMEGILSPLEHFRKKELGGVKDGKKKFDKDTAKFCQSLERYLSLNSKTSENLLKEADRALEMERSHFYEESMKYVLLLQETQEKKKFQFVEILLGFMYSLLTFYHQGHEVALDFKPYMTDLQMKLQRCRANFEATREEAEQLMNKMLSQKNDQNSSPKTCAREGYLFVKEKKALGTTWTKHYCTFQKENRIFTMIPYHQNTGKGITTETIVVASCVRKAAHSIEKRFCFDISVQDKNQVLTLQALSSEDRRQWLDAMDGKEPIYSQPAGVNNDLDSLLDDIGFSFIKRCIAALETRGLEEQGLYRINGVGSKVSKLTNMGLDRRKADKLLLDNDIEWETKTVTSAVKNYFRTLPEPLMTFNMHHRLIEAAKNESRTLRINEIHELVHTLPEPSFEMLEVLCQHLKAISEMSDRNLMTVANLGVCFGPTLMRSREETLSNIMDIKWCNLVVEILIDNYHQIFKTRPQFADLPNVRVLDSQPVISTPSSATSSPAPSAYNHASSGYSSQSDRATPVPHAASVPHAAAAAAASTGPARGAAPTAYPPPPPSATSRGDPAQYNNNYNHSHSPPSAASSSSPMTSSMTSSVPTSGGGSPPPGYANLSDSGSGNSVMSQSYDPGPTYAQYRAKLRPNTGFYNQYSVDHASSASSSTESLNSKCSTSSVPAATSQGDARRPPAPAAGGAAAGGGVGAAVAGTPSHVAAAINRFSLPYPPAPPSASTTPTPSPTPNNPSTGNNVSRVPPPKEHGSSSTVSSGGSGPSAPANTQAGKKVRTLYACEAENETELSFEPNQFIYGVKRSREPGWLEGTLDGKTGLIPANYVEFV